jgi:hypothetical protein
MRTYVARKKLLPGHSTVRGGKACWAGIARGWRGSIEGSRTDHPTCVSSAASGLRQGREDSRRKTPLPILFSGIYDTLNTYFNYTIFIITNAFQLITYSKRQR